MDINWNPVVEELGPKLFRYFRSRFSYEESSDLAQETLIRLVQKFREGTFDSARGSLRMYAYGIAHFVALESRQSSKRLEPIPDVQNTIHFEEHYLAHESHEQLRKALQRLEPTQVQIISYMIDEELTLADISALLDLPLGTVKSHVHRAKQRLREIMGNKESL